MTGFSPHTKFHQTAVGDPDALEIWCYSDRLSYLPGETLRVHVMTTAKSYDLALLRDGAAPQVYLRQEGLPGVACATPEDCSVQGCGWPVAFELVLPDDWPSGAYVIEATAKSEDGAVVEHHHLFILAPAGPGAGGRLLLVAATGTWTAYNDWGGSNHYEGITGANRDLYAPVLSVRRPWARGFVRLPAEAPRVPVRQPLPPGTVPTYPHMAWAFENGYSKKYASAGWASYERPFVIWAEGQGYAVDVIAQSDLQFRPEILAGYRCLCCVGHDEYWSWEMRDAVDRFVEGGGRVARFAGNFMWQIRLEDEGRVQVCYKYRARAEDPVRDAADRSRLTTSWEAREVGRPGAATFGLNALRGVYAGWGGCAPRGSGGFTVYRPEHWAFAGTDLYYGDVFGGASRVFGYEVDGLDYRMEDGLPVPSGTDGAPQGLEILALGLASPREENHGHDPAALFIGDEDLEFAAEILHGRADAESLAKTSRGNGMIVHFPRGAGEVFHAGTCEWVAGLIDQDDFVERITRTVLDRFLTA